MTVDVTIVNREIIIAWKEKGELKYDFFEVTEYCGKPVFLFHALSKDEKEWLIDEDSFKEMNILHEVLKKLKEINFDFQKLLSLGERFEFSFQLQQNTKKNFQKNKKILTK